MKLNIQLFADEADNDVDVDESTDSGDAATENEETPVDKTKAFSDRLKAKTQDIEKKYADDYNSRLNTIAKEQGYETWEQFEKWLWSKGGAHTTNDHTYNYIPVGDLLPLILMALIYVIILFVKRNKTAQL